MNKYFVTLLIAVFILFSCKKENQSTSILTKENISGYVQKGPFINGTSISINELNTNLSQTGKVYNTQVVDNKGSFNFGNVELKSNYVSLRADGFYFNEISGEQSKSQITLYALSDVSNKSSVNINLLTHLEKARIEYLISEGIDFQDAKKQALSEIIKIFSINEATETTSETLDIAKKGDDNGKLLAISLILQGYRSEGELTELLSNISTDIREDGILDNKTLGSELINHTVYLNLNSIRENLEKRFSDLGVNAEVPDFEKYINAFIENSTFDITASLIEYPSLGENGKNILDLNELIYGDAEFSLAANLHQGTKLKIKITSLGTKDFFMQPFTVKNWTMSVYNETTKSQYFTAIDSDKNCDLLMVFDSGDFLIEYFEMGALEPNRTKIIRSK
ncbi:MAG TPA: hypothetical protein VLZ75_03255 [Chitinophagales bacterium]|nr:hypothetical protein [Chitinophagales bacterium]